VEFGNVTAYYAQYDHDGSLFLDAAGNERRDIVDVRYAGAHGALDWDLETMGEGGSVGSTRIRAWAIGSWVGYSLANVQAKPRIGQHVGAASGDRHPGDGVLGTFNPLFPNGYYFTLAGFPGYTNLVHIKPSITLQLNSQFTVMAAIGAQWRYTTADAIHVQPNVAVPGTRGEGSRWSGAHAQFRADRVFTRQWTGSIEVDHYQVGDAIRNVGGRNADYLGLELKFGW
jgi:Alginate export